MSKTPFSVLLEADGASRGNPGTAGFGALVRDAETMELVGVLCAPLRFATCNVAEYRALIAGLRLAAEVRADHVEVRMDSKLVIEQMAGRWKVKHPGLKPLHAEAQELIWDFQSIKWRWVPREQNVRADKLSNLGADGRSEKMIYRPA